MCACILARGLLGTRRELIGNSLETRGKKNGETFQLRFLGPVQVERDGEPVGSLESRKALAVLACVEGTFYPRGLVERIRLPCLGTLIDRDVCAVFNSASHKTRGRAWLCLYPVAPDWVPGHMPRSWRDDGEQRIGFQPAAALYPSTPQRLSLSMLCLLPLVLRNHRF